MSRATRQTVINTLIAVGAGLIAQGWLYVETTREDIHDLKRDMAAVSCKVAIYTRSAELPDGCHPSQFVAAP